MMTKKKGADHQNDKREGDTEKSIGENHDNVRRIPIAILDIIAPYEHAFNLQSTKSRKALSRKTRNLAIPKFHISRRAYKLPNTPVSQDVDS